MLRAAIQAEHRARHELDPLQAQPLPEQNSVHIRPIRQQRDGHYPRTGALEAMQRDRIAGVLGEHDRILADKRLADEDDALLAAVDDKNILIRGRDAARGQTLPQRLRVGG